MSRVECRACEAMRVHADDCPALMHGDVEYRLCTCGVGVDWENWVISSTFVYTRVDP